MLGIKEISLSFRPLDIWMKVFRIIPEIRIYFQYDSFEHPKPIDVRINGYENINNLMLKKFVYLCL